MRNRTVRVALLALIVAVGAAGDGQAQKRIATEPVVPEVASEAPQNSDPGQKPPLSEPQPAKSEQPKCIDDEARYAMIGRQPSYVITLRNSCDSRIRCAVNAYVVGAKGSATGAARLTLAAGSKGSPATKAYTMKVRQIGGMATLSFDCKAL